MVEIRRVGILSLALMLGLLYTALGLILGLIFACITLFGVASFAASMEELAGIGGGGVLVAGLYAICFPILYGVIGFISGAVIGLLYNLIAGIAGGIKIELREL
jgi:hypothetical protein